MGQDGWKKKMAKEVENIEKRKEKKEEFHLGKYIFDVFESQGIEKEKLNKKKGIEKEKLNKKKEQEEQKKIRLKKEAELEVISAKKQKETDREEIIKKYTTTTTTTTIINNNITTKTDTSVVIDWEKLFETEVFSENFIREFKDYFDWEFWGFVSKYQTLSEDFIREFGEEVDWQNIFKYQNITEDFVEEFKECFKECFEGLGGSTNYGPVSIDFIRKCKNYIKWDKLGVQFLSQSLSDAFFEEFKDYIVWWYNCSPIYERDFFTENFIRELFTKNKISIYRLGRAIYYSDGCWGIEGLEFSIDFMVEFKDEINWDGFFESNSNSCNFRHIGFWDRYKIRKFVKNSSDDKLKKILIKNKDKK